MAKRAIADISDYYQHLNVAKQELSNVLRTVAQRERQKEFNYLQIKVNSLPDGQMKTRALVLLQEHISGSATAISALFNLILQSESEMAALMKEGPDILKNRIHFPLLHP